MVPKFLWKNTALAIKNFEEKAMNSSEKETKRIYRHKRIRKKISGTGECPRLCVHRSHKNFFAQIIDDGQKKILFSMSTLAKDFKGDLKSTGNIPAALALGQIFGKKAQEKGIKKVSFDRGGYLYHGRVKAFAEGARKSGMEF